MSLESKLIVKRVYLERDRIETFDFYPFDIECIKNFHELNFKSPVTFLVGENGVGKSTFIEALAVSLDYQLKVVQKTLDMKQKILLQSYLII